MIKKFFPIAFLWLLLIDVHACERGTHKELVQFWNSFLPMATNGSPEELSKYFLFPIKLHGAHKEMKPINITKKTFLQHHDVIFKKNSAGEESTLFRNLKHYSLKEPFGNITLQDFDSTGCFKRERTNIGDYSIYRTNNGTWKIIGMDASSDYEIILSELKFLKNR